MSRIGGVPARLRERPAVRFSYAAALAAGIVGGYKLIDARHRLRLGVPDRDAAVHAHHRASARRVYHGAVRLQGLMIKIGQTIGSNPVGFPIEYVEVLSRLQDRVPPRSWAEIRPGIEQALGRPVGEVFAEFSRRPVAAASLAQVHRARLHDGRPVAVKVLYPGIERLVQSDLRVLRLLLWLDGRTSSYPTEPVYRELAQNVPLEVDLVHEAEAMGSFIAQLSDDPRIVIPGVVRELSSRRLLVMEWVDGVKLTDHEGLRRAGHDRQALADLLLDTYCRQILIDGSFHADPHPGNLFALPGGRLAIVDFGLTKRLAPAFRRSLAKMTRALFTGDIPTLVEAFGELGYRVTRGEDHAVYTATAEFFQTITDPTTHADGPASMQAINARWIQAVKKNPIVAIPGDTTLVWRVFALLMGVGASMGARPHVVETVLKYTDQVSQEPTESSRGAATDAAGGS